LDERDYDLVLMDCQMPIMDGFEATRKIRSIHKYKHIPIIAVTANARDSERKQCLSSGMIEPLTQPVSARYLKKVLLLWLAKTKKR